MLRECLTEAGWWLLRRPLFKTRHHTHSGSTISPLLYLSSVKLLEAVFSPQPPNKNQANSICPQEKMAHPWTAGIWEHLDICGQRNPQSPFDFEYEENVEYFSFLSASNIKFPVFNSILVQWGGGGGVLYLCQNVVTSTDHFHCWLSFHTCCIFFHTRYFHFASQSDWVAPNWHWYDLKISISENPRTWLILKKQFSDDEKRWWVAE